MKSFAIALNAVADAAFVATVPKSIAEPIATFDWLYTLIKTQFLIKTFFLGSTPFPNSTMKSFAIALIAVAAAAFVASVPQPSAEPITTFDEDGNVNIVIKHDVEDRIL